MAYLAYGSSRDFEELERNLVIAAFKSTVSVPSVD